MIIVKNHKSSIEKIKSEFPGSVIIDVTSHAKDCFIKLSPFYPHGRIPVPFSKGWYAMSVESIWQGLKDYKSVGIDISLFNNTTMQNLKRTTRRFGQMLGHRKGVCGKELLGYITARKLIYLPTYKWVLENKVSAEVEKIREIAKHKTVILLDYATNGDVENTSSALSHAALIKMYIEGNYPEYEWSDRVEKEEKSDKPMAGEFFKGQNVKHPVFGNGIVKEIEGERVRVEFESVGEKLLAIRLAKLEAA